MTTALPRGLYGMLDLPPVLPPFSTLARSLYQPLFAAGVGVLQLRMKDAAAGLMLQVLSELRAQRPAGTLLIVNDRLDVALAGGADGVHLGQQDLPLSAARALCPPGFLVGFSTHNEEQAAAAMGAGADYIALGPIFPTSTKRNPDPVVGVARLRAVCKGATVPVVAIGGITLDRVAEVVAAGAQAAAIIAAVNAAPDIRGAALSVQRSFGVA